MSAFLIKDPRFVLIHIPKTGGTSIRHGMFNSAYEGPVMGHIPDEWMDCTKAAFVRNPYDRAVSAWKMFSSGMERTKAAHTQCCDWSFRQFLDVVTDESIPYDYTGQDALEVRMRHHALPMTHPYNCLAAADFIGRYERYEADVLRLVQCVGYTPIGPVPHWNTTRRSDYRDYYTDVEREMVGTFYREDCELFGYEFETDLQRAVA